MKEIICVVPDECIDEKVQRLRELVKTGAVNQPIILDIIDDLETAVRTIKKIDDKAWEMKCKYYAEKCLSMGEINPNPDYTMLVGLAEETLDEIGHLCCGGSGNFRYKYAKWC